MTTLQTRTVGGVEQLQAAFVRESRSLWRDSWRRLLRNRAAALALSVIVLFALIAIASPWITPYSYEKQNLDRIAEAPSWQHIMGTDQLGRDVFSRLIYGSRISFAVAVAAQIVIVGIGVPMGLVSGYFGGTVDTLITRVIDILYAFPNLLLTILIISYLRANLSAAVTEDNALWLWKQLDKSSGGLIAVFIVMALTYWIGVARLVRGQVLSIKKREFIEAARSIGLPAHRILRVHLFPNILAPVIVAAAFGIPGAIMLEAGLSYLGLGIQPPLPSWGGMISEGLPVMRSYPHLIVFPALALSTLLLAFTYLGDGLRDALDPLME
jgi:ABC-type dipeptide/oligopeptide/nickel transport system permease subunit